MLRWIEAKNSLTSNTVCCICPIFFSAQSWPSDTKFPFQWQRLPRRPGNEKWNSEEEISKRVGRPQKKCWLQVCPLSRWILNIFMMIKTKTLIIINVDQQLMWGWGDGELPQQNITRVQRLHLQFCHKVLTTMIIMLMLMNTMMRDTNSGATLAVLSQSMF